MYSDETERKQAEETLRDSEERLNEAQRIGSVGDWEFDVENQQVYWSEQVYRLFERDPTQCPPTYEENMAYYYPEDSKKLQEQVGRAIEFGEDSDTDYHLKLPSGKSVYQHGIIRTKKDENGRVIKLYGVVEDITERKRREEEQRLQAEIAANMSEGVYLIRASDGVILYTNPRFGEIFGYGPDEMVGKHVSIVNAPTDMTPQETVDHIVGIMKQTGFWKGEIQNIKKDGTPFWCYASASLFEHPEYGEIIVSVHTEITDRKQVEEALRESEERNRILIEAAGNSGQAIAIHQDSEDVEASTIFANDAAKHITGYTDEELMNLSWFDILPSTYRDPSRERYRRRMGGENISGLFESFIFRKDGTEIPIEASSIVTKFRGKNAQVSFFRDIRERKQAEEELKQSEERYRALVESSSDAILMLDSERKIVSCNQAFLDLFGYGNNEVVVKTSSKVRASANSLRKSSFKK